MQLANSLLQYMTAQRNAALNGDPKDQRHGKQHRLNRHSQSLASVKLAESLLWGTGSLHSVLPEAFDELVSITDLLSDLDCKKLRSKREAKNKQAVMATAQWINGHLPLDGSDSFVALIAAGWIYSMRYATASISSSLWLETLQNVLTQVDRAWTDCDSESILPTLIWGCEIPLALATHIDQVDGQTKLVLETRERLKFLIHRVEDTERMWLRSGGMEVRALLAGVLRCTWLLKQLGGKELAKKDYKQLLKYARAGLSLSEIGGQPLLQEDAYSEDDELWHTLIADWPSDDKLTALAHAIHRKPKKDESAKIDSTKLPALGQVFEDSEAAVMRINWTSNASCLAIDFSSDPIWLQVYGPHRQRLLDGAWELKVEQEGVEVAIDCPWEQICWQSDDETDYLELQCEAEGICKVQRQVFFIRNEAMIFLCDTLLAERNSHWQLTSSWQLANGTQIETFDESHEVRLVACESKKGKTIAKPVAIALPIALSEWRSANSTGELSTDQSTLALRQHGTGTRLMCPLVLGVGAKSASAPFTWRHLTVADDMKIQPFEQARGFRVQIGSDQMLFYRSLGQLRRRTMMSLHLYSEFYAGRFDRRDGEIESLVDVSPAEEE